MRFHKILVPFDNSPASARALDEALELAQVSGSRVRLVHVLDELALTQGFEPARLVFEDILAHLRQAGSKLLAAACGKAAAREVTADGVLAAGGPGRVCDHVVEEARRWQADLIVLGSHGRHGLGRLLLGSDAEQILRHAPVPVLVVRP
jgi:nucleotide-binding universal stress UspA family protein